MQAPCPQHTTPPPRCACARAAWERNLQDYAHQHPGVTVIDRVDGIRALQNRATMLSVLDGQGIVLKVGAGSLRRAGRGAGLLQQISERQGGALSTSSRPRPGTPHPAAGRMYTPAAAARPQPTTDPQEARGEHFFQAGAQVTPVQIRVQAPTQVGHQ